MELKEVIGRRRSLRYFQSWRNVERDPDEIVAADSRERARRGNIIRSFLIHNGILLQAGIQI